MHLGFATLRLSSNAFWAMTPRELAAVLPPDAQRPAIDLTSLMLRFPDETGTASAEERGDHEP